MPRPLNTQSSIGLLRPPVRYRWAGISPKPLWGNGLHIRKSCRESPTSCCGEFKPVLGETTFIGHNACYCLWRTLPPLALPVVGFQLICLFICRNRTHLRILTSTSDIQPAIYCTGPSIIYIPHYVLDRNCALGVLRFCTITPVQSLYT